MICLLINGAAAYGSDEFVDPFLEEHEVKRPATFATPAARPSSIMRAGRHSSADQSNDCRYDVKLTPAASAQRPTTIPSSFTRTTAGGCNNFVKQDPAPSHCNWIMSLLCFC